MPSRHKSFADLLRERRFRGPARAKSLRESLLCESDERESENIFVHASIPRARDAGRCRRVAGLYHVSRGMP